MLDKMKQAMETLVWEVFEQEERRVAELRLTAAEAAYLQREYGAACEAMDADEREAEKHWYLVRMP